MVVMMERRSLLIGALALFFVVSSQASSSDLSLYTFLAPPYQVSSGPISQPTVRGETTETIRCASREAGWEASIQIAPQKRAVHSLARNLVDGFFAVDPSAQLDAIARRSDPVSLEKWYFFSNTPGPISRDARIGVVSGSNEQAWLLANNYNVFLGVTSTQQLLALLERNRIDVALLDERVMTNMHTEESDLHTTFVRYAPLHLYLAEAFTYSHPGFLDRFNKALPECTKDTLTLSMQERTHVKQLAAHLLTDLNATVDLRQALDTGPQVDTLAEALTLDSEWRALAPNHASKLASRILDLPSSHALKGWQKNHATLVTEVLLMNSMGTLSAISQLTSDYWQGDEAKFRRIMKPSGEEHDALYISPIRYDASTKRFQIMISAAVTPEGSNTPIGAIAIGLNIEPALQSGDGEAQGPTADQPRTPGPAPRIQKNR